MGTIWKKREGLKHFNGVHRLHTLHPFFLIPLLLFNFCIDRKHTFALSIRIFYANYARGARITKHSRKNTQADWKKTCKVCKGCNPVKREDLPMQQLKLDIHTITQDKKNLTTYRGAFCSHSTLGKIHGICGRKKVKKCLHAGRKITIATCASCKYRDKAALRRMGV